MKEELSTVTPEGTADYDFISMGLHDYPDKLRAELQNRIDCSEGYDMTILGFGFCGQSANGLRASHCNLVMPRVHECIPLLLGSRHFYDELEQQKGTYFLTGGWTEGDKALLAEFRRTSEKFGEEEAADLFGIMFANYSRLVYINTCHPRNSSAKQYSKQVSDLLKLDFQERTGNTGYMERLVNGPWDEKDFIMIQKGESVSDTHFSL